VYRGRIENRIRRRNGLASSVKAWTTAHHCQRQSGAGSLCADGKGRTVVIPAMADGTGSAIVIGVMPVPGTVRLSPTEALRTG
jgi:hypothetical protein